MPFEFGKNEEKILQYWDKNKVFEKSVSQRKGKPNFVFFEGPPTANGKPGIHHLIARSFKDIICRFKAMQGYYVERKGGWDTHGLPVEIEVEKKLGIKHKTEIESFGVAKFNKLCQESVWQYKEEWEKFTKRIGYWVDLKNPYITYQTNYIESLWNILAKTFKSGLLYKDFRVAPYCPRCGTTLSSHEVSQGYQTVKDNSVFVKFPIKTGGQKFSGAALLVWTTTPWTLPANVAVALNPHLKYCLIETPEQGRLIMAKSRLAAVLENAKAEMEFSGKELLGLEYEPPFYYKGREIEGKDIYKIIEGDFVSETDGTGFVHIAPAFGEDDMQAIKALREAGQADFPVLATVDSEGDMQTPGYAWNGKFVKEADPLIIEDLRARGLLFKEEKYEHEYPFCWRCKSPLIYYATPSWFIKMRALKERLQESNKGINWVPEHMREGRFGVWLSEIKDWNLSRNRFWGTPLPIWQCENKECKHEVAISSLADLRSQKYTTNKFYILRHGFSEALKERKNCCWPEPFHCPLTAAGRKEVELAAKKLSKKNITAIYSSDLLRTRQTAEIIAKILGVEVIYDQRIREMDCGDFNGQLDSKLQEWFKKQENMAFTKIPGGESYFDVQKRMKDFVTDIDSKNENQNILIVSHESPLTMLELVLDGQPITEDVKWRWENAKKRIKTGEVRELDFVQLPLDDKLAINLHKPYIDEISFACEKCGRPMYRTPEIIDCWFDSGSMPFAQQHYPFENVGKIERNPSGNEFYIMRHGHSERQLKKVASSWPENPPLHLTAEGVGQALQSAEKISELGIDLIFTSDLLRTRQTADIVAKQTGAKVILEKRLREYNAGVFSGQESKKGWEYLFSKGNRHEHQHIKLPKGESQVELRQRMVSLLKDLNKKYKNKKILLVSHELPLSILEGTLMGYNLPDLLEKRFSGGFTIIETAGWRKLDLSNWYEDQGDKKAQFPADYICEGVDQTRGWFYTLLAVSTLMGRQSPYRNVISLGHVLDQNGEKMSKSRGNIVSPWDIINKYGTDAARWYFYTINSPGEPKLFNEKDVDGVVKRFLMIYLNCLVFFETYGLNKPVKTKPVANNVLDKWILSRLNSLILEMTGNLERFEITEAARSLEKFLVDDLSLWYIRRSRKRFQNPKNRKDLAAASAVLHYVFSNVAILGAPFIPFFSEEVWQRLGYKNSVHLAQWPKAQTKATDKKLEKMMGDARQIIGDALALRAKAGVKVRQPLRQATIKQKEILSNKGICGLIKDELNVKSVIMGKELALDFNITPELKEEGIIRDAMRFIQEARKEADLKPVDKIIVIFSGEGELLETIKRNQDKFGQEARIAKIGFSVDKPEYPIEKEIVIDGKKILASIKKIK